MDLRQLLHKRLVHCNKPRHVFLDVALHVGMLECSPVSCQRRAREQKEGAAGYRIEGLLVGAFPLFLKKRGAEMARSVVDVWMCGCVDVRMC